MQLWGLLLAPHDPTMKMAHLLVIILSWLFPRRSCTPIFVRASFHGRLYTYTFFSSFLVVINAPMLLAVLALVEGLLHVEGTSCAPSGVRAYALSAAGAR